MEAFTWDQRFETGISVVDKQHRHLVDLVNLAGDILLEGKASEEELQKLFGQLADYAVYHFTEEENMMEAHHLDARHVNAHKSQHAEFLTQVTLMWNNRHVAENPAAMLHGFLSSWLTVHILGQDQEMARILNRIKSGEGPVAAYDAEHGEDDRRISPLLDALHKLYALLSIQNRELADANAGLEDKVRERTRELEEAGRQLLQSEKQASLGRMVAGFAHEINTPVGIALSAISQTEDAVRLLKAMFDREEVSEDDFIAELNTLDEAGKLALANLNRASKLVKSFKRTSIDQSFEQLSEFELLELIHDVLATVHNEFKRTSIKIEVDCPVDIRMTAVPGLLEQLFTNLLLNSLQHAFNQGQQSGHIRISVEHSKGGSISLTYSDDGAGMATEVVEKAFEPFYTTARGEGGSGLGLYVCYSIVTAQLGGSISLSSTPGKGSRFEISLPAKTKVANKVSA